MPTEYVRGYQDQSGGSHMFALWMRQTPPDEDDTNGWVWVRADKVMWIESVNDRDRGADITKIVFDGGVTLRTDAPASDVRWGIDLALNGGKQRIDSDTTNEAYKEASLAGFLAAEALLKRERDGK